MKTMRSATFTVCFFLLIGLFFGLFGSLVHAAGTDYPNKTISIILGVPPGGVTDMGARLLAQFIEYARKNPGTKFGHIGKSTTQYVIMTSIIKAEKLNLVDVPFDGDGTMVPALLGGHVPIGTPVLNVIKSLVEGKKLKVLGVALPK